MFHMDDPKIPLAQLPDVAPPTDAEWREAREALAHATHRAGCPKKTSEHAGCTCGVDRWAKAIQV